MNSLRSIKFLFYTLFFTSLFSCVNSDFDEPPSNTSDPEISADKIISLEEVMKLRIPGDYVKIGLDKFVKAVVVADDASGNFYKTIVVEDENSDYGISILIDEVELYNVFPVGRRVFINVKDLWISDYNGLPQIGYGPFVENNRKKMASIPSTIFKEIIKPGMAGIKVEPFETTISQLSTVRLNTLIKINNIEFLNQGETYSDATTQTTLNRTLSTCSQEEILLRNSGFADFAGTLVPSGKGSIIAIYSIFGTDKQLMIRDTTDVDMKQPRCGATAGDEPRISIQDMKAVFTGSKTTAPKSYIQGVVISDLKYKNIATQNLVIQDGNHGIVVRFTSTHSFQLGQEIKVVATDVELSEFNGLLQLNNVPNGYASVVGQGTLPTPKVLTIKEVKDNLSLYESTLVTIKDAEVKSPSTYNGNVNLDDATGTIIMRTTSAATFATSNVPTGKIDVTAIVSEFTTSTVTPQLSIRNTTDVTGGTPTGEGKRISIESVKAKYTGTKTTAPDGFIQGVVISDFSNKNLTSKNLVIQDGSFGITVRLSIDNTFPIGKEIKIITNGVELSEFNKLLQLNNVPVGNVTVIGDGTLPTPKIVTIEALKSSFEALESTLVTINNATISGAAIYAGTLKIADPTGQIDLFTRTDATFAGSAVPATPKTVTGIVSEFTTASSTSNGYQLNLRSLDDVK